MSSDESTSTQISGISSIAEGNENKLKSHKPDQWEINLIGNFLLTLYHRLEIAADNDWLCKKSDLRKKFEEFVTPELRKRLKEANGTDNIGSLLHRCNFLFNTPRGNQYYKLKSRSIFEFNNRKLLEQDKRKINDDADSTANAGPEDILKNLVEPQTLPTIQQANYEIDEDSPKHELNYEGTTMQQRRQNYFPTNMSCYICQQDFATMDSYEEHIQIHNDEREFEYLKQLSRFDTPIFSISYKLCKNSHHFGFTIETKNSNLIIEKIIIVQSRSMFYVHNMRVPYAMPANGIENFFVDSHLFAIFVEQPIILVCHLGESKDTRIIEEHHFMRALEFPKVNFAIRPFQLPSKKTFKPKFKLPDYFPPLEIRDALKDDFIYEKLMKTSNEFRDYVRNGKILQPQTIGQTLTTLLHIEDMDAIKEYLNLLQHNVKLRSFGDNYSMRLRTKQRVHIENVLSIFDEVIITTRKDLQPESDDLVKMILQNRDDMDMSRTYLGQIEDVNSGRVSFKCYKKIDLNRTYTVVFRPSRSQLRHQYRAMEVLPVVMPLLSKFLFPRQLMTKVPSTISLELYNRSIANNPEQLQAVRNIAEGPRNDATYIIFGPPGTGKTTTVVESILQVLKRDGTKILVTASSNSACDEVAIRLCKTLSRLDMARSIVRIYAQSNEARMDTIDDLLLEHSNMYSVHFYPDIEVLHEYRIVVCTMSVVAKLALGKFGRTESGGTMYTHLFIDEVAASTEVEALVPITSILTPKSSLIIAGDHKQLGPIVKSKRAEEFNLGVSLMDRLLLRECYRVNTDTGDYDRTIQTRLRMNFRSHPAIVNLYSGMYYNHDLEAKVDIDNVSLAKNWHMAPNKDFPIIFHSISGNSYSDKQSYSLYNSEEINVVMDYVKVLMYFGVNGKPVKETDIGVISPYKKQYLRIREELNLRKWYQIETGSVETFQGKEKNIIIVSFVRSNTSTLGFLESPRRLNVTLSRAKSMLILIGNARTLSINPDYDYIIKECQRHKTLIGRIDQGPPPSSSSTSFRNNNDQSDSRRKNPKFNQSNDKKDTTLDMVNKTLKDLKLKNKNEYTNRVNKNHKRPQPVGGKKNKPETDKENRNIDDDDDNDSNDDEDDDDDNDSDDGDCDDKPSTSKAAGKPHLSQPMKKKNQMHPKQLGNIATAKKGNKENLKAASKVENAKSKGNLDDIFNELPSVPKTTITTTPNISNVQQLNRSQTNNDQIPSLMNMQIPPLAPTKNSGPKQNRVYFLQQQQMQQQQMQQQQMQQQQMQQQQFPVQQSLFGPGPPNQANFMGPLTGPRPMQQHTNQKQWQGAQLQWQQQQLRQQNPQFLQQQQQRQQNPQFLQQQQQRQQNPQLLQEQQLRQLNQQLHQYQSHFQPNQIFPMSPINNGNSRDVGGTNDQNKIDKNETNASNGNKESKNARRRRNKQAKDKNKTEENKEDPKDKDDDDHEDDKNDHDDDDNKASSSKTPGKPHLGHSMKKKNQTKNIAKVSKTLKSVTQNSHKAQDAINETNVIKPKVTPRQIQQSTINAGEAMPAVPKPAPRKVNSPQQETTQNSIVSNKTSIYPDLKKSMDNATKTSRTNQTETLLIDFNPAAQDQIKPVAGNKAMSDFYRATQEQIKPVASIKAMPVTTKADNDNRSPSPLLVDLRNSIATSAVASSTTSPFSPNAINRSSAVTMTDNDNRSPSPLLVDLRNSIATSAVASSTTSPFSSNAINRSSAVTTSSSSSFRNTFDNLNRSSAATNIHTSSANRPVTTSSPWHPLPTSDNMNRSSVATNMHASSINRPVTTPTPSTTRYMSDNLNSSAAATNMHASSTNRPVTTPTPSTTRYMSDNLNRSSAATNMHASSTNRPVTTPTPSTTRYTSDNLNRSSVATNNYASATNRPVTTPSPSTSRYISDSMSLSAASINIYEEVPYIQPHRPVRNFSVPESEPKKKDNCIIA